MLKEGKMKPRGRYILILVVMLVFGIYLIWDGFQVIKKDKAEMRWGDEVSGIAAELVGWMRIVIGVIFFLANSLLLYFWLSTTFTRKIRGNSMSKARKNG